MSALTLSLHPSCVNANMVGVKKTSIQKKDKAHLVQSLSSLQCTLMTDPRPLFSSVTTSHSSTQENGCGASMKCRPVMVAKAVNAFLTMWIPRRALCFSDYKSIHTWGETFPLGWCHVKCLSPQGKKSVSEKTLHTFTAQYHTFMTDITIQWINTVIEQKCACSVR